MAEDNRPTASNHLHDALTSMQGYSGAHLWRTVIDNLPDLVFVKDRQGRFVLVNQATARLKGFDDPEGLVGLTDFDVSPAEVARRFLEDDRSVMETGQPIVAHEEPVHLPDGRVEWLSTTKIPWRGPDGEVRGIIAIAKIITLRKEAETALERHKSTLEETINARTEELTQANRRLRQEVEERRRAEDALGHERNRLRTLIDNLPAMIYVKDSEGRFLVNNLASARSVGCEDPADMIGKTDFDVSPADLAALYAADDRRVLESGEPIVDRIEPAAGKDGEERWYSTTKIPLKDRNGDVTGLVGISQDITQQKCMEEALRASEELYRTLFEQAYDAIFLEDTKDNILDANRRACEMYGYTREEMLRLKVSDVVPRERYDDRPIVTGSLAHSRGTTFELPNVRKDGSIFPIEISLTAVKERRDDLVLAVVRDVSERKRAEAEILKRGRELTASNEQLAQALKAKDEFLATVSHELRTPLNAILGLTESMREGVLGDLNDRQRHALESVERSGNHLVAVINDVLDVAKIESGGMVVEPEKVPVESLCQASLALVREAAFKKSLDVGYTRDPRVDLILADGRRLKQVLVNLLANAVKFTPEGGSLGLAVECEPAREIVRFVVWDSGIGIAEADMARMFKPFVQVDSTLARRYGGTGLGLSLAYKMTALHGGSVAVESKPGRGSRFTVTLPWQPESNADVFTHQEQAMPEALGTKMGRDVPVFGVPGQTPLGRPLIALAEDALVDAVPLTDRLSSRGYTVKMVPPGLEIVGSCVQLAPDLLILGMQPRNADGLDLVRRLRAEPSLARLRLITLTALETPGDREAAQTAGADAYLRKPVSPSDMEEAVRGLLS